MTEDREDYIERALSELRRFVAEVLGTRDEAKLDEALLAVVQAQEKLFGRPASEFRFPDVNAQLAMLSEGETRERARAKCLAYSSILEQAGLIYAARDHPDLANSAFQLALYVRLIVAQEGECGPEFMEAIGVLVERIPADELHAPTLDLLERLNGWR